MVASLSVWEFGEEKKISVSSGHCGGLWMPGWGKYQIKCGSLHIKFTCDFIYIFTEMSSLAVSYYKWVFLSIFSFFKVVKSSDFLILLPQAHKGGLGRTREWVGRFGLRWTRSHLFTHHSPDVMGWTVSPQNSYVEALTLCTSVFGDEAFNMAIKWKRRLLLWALI